MIVEPVEQFKYFECPLCGAEFHPTDEAKSVTVWVRPDGEKFCHESCANTDSAVDNYFYEGDRADNSLGFPDTFSQFREENPFK